MLSISYSLFALAVLPFAAKGKPTYLDGTSQHSNQAVRSFDLGSRSFNELDESPRVADVIQYLESSTGGLNWTDVDDGQGSYVVHTFEEWAAAEQAVLGYKANTFAHSMSLRGGDGLYSGIQPNSSARSLENSGSESSSTYRYQFFDRRGVIDGGHDIPRGVVTDDPGRPSQTKAARFFCYNKGQFGTKLAFNLAATAGCYGVAKGLEIGGIKTWRSYRLPEPPPNNKNYAMFLTFSTVSYELITITVCATLLSQLQDTVCQAEGIKPSKARDNTPPAPPDKGPYVSRGAIWRGYDSVPGTPADRLGPMLWELKVDPNECEKNGNPC